MESGSFTIGKVHIVRVDPGEDVLASVKAFLVGAGVRQAVDVGTSARRRWW